MRVHTEGLAHLDALVPILTRDAGVMHFGGLDHEGFVVQQEGFVADLEGAGLGNVFGCNTVAAEETGSEGQRENQLFH